MPLKKKNALVAAAKAKVRATITPARIKMAEQTLKNVKAVIPKKTQKALAPKVKAGAKKLMNLAKKIR